MPAVTTDNILTLPRVNRPTPLRRASAVRKVVTARSSSRARASVGPFRVDFRDSDPFLLLDHLGAVSTPGEAKGAPGTHRGFETVTSSWTAPSRTTTRPAAAG